MISDTPEGAPSKRLEKKKRKQNFEKQGSIKIRWCKLKDGRTRLDLRKWRTIDRQPTFVDHSEAIAEAQRIALELNAGGSESQVITATDRAELAFAKGEAAKVGMTLPAAISEWSEARRIASEINGDLLEIAKAGVKELKVQSHPIQDVVLEMIASKRRHDLHGRYYSGLKSTGLGIAAALKIPIEQVTAKHIETFVDGELDSATGKRCGGSRKRNGEVVGPWRRNNILREIQAIWKFARDRGYLPDKKTEAAKVEIVKRVKSHIGLVTPEQMRIYLEFVDAHYLPWLVINAFAGVRTEEIALAHDAPKRKDPLRWEDFDWKNMEIKVRPETSKTGIPRPCPILPNLFAWLAPWRDGKAKGYVCPRIKDGRQPEHPGYIARPDKERQRFIAKAREAIANDMTRTPIDLTYPRNGFRHTYCTMRIAELKDMGKVAYEAGDSIAMQKRNYNNPRPEAEAKAWFGIFPDGHYGNVVQGAFNF